MLKIRVITCAYKRPEIFKVFLKSFLQNKSSLKKDVHLSLTVVGSSKDDGGVCKAVFDEFAKEDCHWVEHKNNPLGSKWNKAMSEALKHKWDYVFITGSDDIYNNNLFKVYLKFIDQGFNYIGVKNFYMIDTKKGDLKFWPGYTTNRRGESVGAGRLLCRKIIEQILPCWQDDLNKTLDGSMTEKIKRTNVNHVVLDCVAHDIMVVDLKSEVNIWGYDKYKGIDIDKEYMLDMKFNKSVYKDAFSIK